MGMDITGKNGAYFRASIWSWPSILSFAESAAQEAQLDIDFTNWCYNDGKGLSKESDCTALADAVDAALKPLIDSKVGAVYSDNLGTMAEALLTAIAGAGWPVMNNTTPKADLEHIAEFSRFLRTCGGGFEIW